jgi:hypothetical protein
MLEQRKPGMDQRPRAAKLGNRRGSKVANQDTGSFNEAQRNFQLSAPVQAGARGSLGWPVHVSSQEYALPLLAISLR